MEPGTHARSHFQWTEAQLAEQQERQVRRYLRSERSRMLLGR